MANRNPNTKGLVPWKPGQSGNPSGRPRMQPISDRYAHIAEEKLPENIRKKLKLGPGATYGDAVALRTFQAALEGDIAATREVREAIEGKAAIRVTEEVRESPQVDPSAIPTRHVQTAPTPLSASGRLFVSGMSLLPLGTRLASNKMQKP